MGREACPHARAHAPLCSHVLFKALVGLLRGGAAQHRHRLLSGANLRQEDAVALEVF